MEQLKNELIYHQRNWHIPGRPLIVFKITAAMLHPEGQDDLIRLIEALQQGEVNNNSTGKTKMLMAKSFQERLRSSIKKLLNIGDKNRVMTCLAMQKLC